MIQHVTMYRVICDAEGCDGSAQDQDDYYAWADEVTAVGSAEDHGWYVGEFGHLCTEHMPRCGSCGQPAYDDDDVDDDGLCEDCLDVLEQVKELGR